MNLQIFRRNLKLSEILVEVRKRPSVVQDQVQLYVVFFGTILIMSDGPLPDQEAHVHTWSLAENEAPG